MAPTTKFFFVMFHKPVRAVFARVHSPVRNSGG